jgi:hypothetical protein
VHNYGEEVLNYEKHKMFFRQENMEVFSFMKYCLKYYSDEHENFRGAYEKILSDDEARTIYERMKSHYKLQQQLTFRGAVFRGHCTRWEVRIPHESPLGLLVHEVAHGIQLKRGKPARWHTKRHASIMRRVLKFVERNMDAWLLVANKKYERKTLSMERREHKMKELEIFKKTPQYKLQVVEKRIRQWQAKKKRAETYLKKLERKRKRLTEL